jgi:PAS domain S-box-containing protein
MEEKYIKIVIHAPNRELFSYLQKNILHEDVELFYIPDIEEIEDFIQRIRPHLLITHLQSEFLLNETALGLYKSPALKDTGIVFILSEKIPTAKLKNLGEFKNYFVFTDKTAPEIIAQNIRAILRKEKSDIEKFNSREYSENILICAKIINQQQNISSLFEKLINHLPKILPYDYIAMFSFDPQLNAVQNFNLFIPPHRRSNAVLTPNLEKLAAVWMKKSKFFQVTISNDPTLFRKLQEWGWGVKQIYFFPIVSQNLPLGGLILGQVGVSRKSEMGTSFIKEINNLLSLKLFNFLLQDKGSVDKDDFTDHLVYNRFSEDSVLQLSCKKISELATSDTTIFWQINRGFGFLFPKFSYGTDNKASWKSLEKTLIYLSKDVKFSQVISGEKIVTYENVYENSKFDESTLATFKKIGYHQLLLAPIHIQNEEIGLFIVNRSQEKPGFTSWNIKQIDHIVDKIKKVLEDTFVVKEANLKLRQLARIFELGNEVKLELSLEKILDRITISIRKTLGWNDVLVMRGDDFQKEYQVISRIGFDGKEELPISLDKTTSYKNIEKLLLDCQKISHSYFYDTNPLEMVRDEKSLVDEVITEWKTSDLLIIPIESRQRMLGYLVVRDPVDRLKPNKDKISALEYFANQAAVAIENSLLYENLQVSEERYRALAETMTLALVTCTMEQKIMYINPAFEKIVGFSEKNLLKQPIINYFSDQSKNKLVEISNDLIHSRGKKKKHIENMELELISAAGEVIPVSTYAFPFIQQKSSKGYFLVLNDLRLVKKLERLKADFNSMIVHDLRSPLNVIQGFIELIRTRVVGEVNEEQEELLDIAKENVKKVLNLVDNFLVASKLEVGKFGIEPKVGELNAILDRIVENHKILLKNKNVILDTKLNKNLPLLYFDSLRIEQVMNNLLSNAVKYSPENSKISIKTDLFPKKIKGEEKFFARIGVADMGPGISSDKMQTVFEKYEQVDSEMFPKSSGTGLGLAICKEIVNLHGGEIWVESEKKKGTIFYFTLPIEPSIDKILK